MTEEFLLEAVGDVKNDYILEAQQLRGGTRVLRRSRGKLWLLAAVIALLAVTATACAVAYARIHMKVVQHNVEPTVQEDAKNVLTACYPQRLPEGYEIWTGTPVDRFTRAVRYRNGTGDIIRFTISTQNDFSDGVMKPPVEEKTVNVAGQEAALLISEQNAQMVRWENTADGYYGCLFTTDMQVDLAAMAQSVASGEEIPVSFLYRNGEPWDIWYPGQVPEGYQLWDVSPIDWGRQTVTYFNEETGESIQYVISTGDDLSDISASNSGTWEQVTVAGQPGKRMTTDSGQRLLFWENAQEGFNAMLSTRDENVDLLAMAESAAPGENLEVSASYLGPDYTIELEQDPTAYVGWEPVYPQQLPEGYTAAFISDPAYGEQNITYENGEGKAIYFTLYFRLGAWGRQFDGLGQPEQVTINGHAGYKISDQQLVWTDESRGFGYALLTNGDADLLKIAKSVAPGAELKPTNAAWTEEALAQLGDYQITDLPDGMVADGLTGAPLEEGGGWYSYVRRWYFDKKTNREIYFEYESYLSSLASPEEMAKAYVGDGAVQMVTVCGFPGAALETDSGVSVAWVLGDGKTGTRFKLVSRDYSAEELVKIAQSVENHTKAQRGAGNS